MLAAAVNSYGDLARQPRALRSRSASKSPEGQAKEAAEDGQEAESEGDDDASPSESTSSGGSAVSAAISVGADADGIAGGVLGAFRVMEVRRSRRLRAGRVLHKGLFARSFEAIEVLLMFAFVMTLFQTDKVRKVFSYVWIPLAFTAALCLPTLYQTMSAPEHTLVTWLTTEVRIWCVWSAWNFHPDLAWPEGECSGWDIGSFCVDATQVSLFLQLMCVMMATMLAYLPMLVVMPCLLASHGRSGRLALWLRDVRPVPRCEQVESGVARFSYRPGVLNCRRAVFSYTGDVDAKGRPHGEGVWSDTSYHGECLRGQWVKGKPAGTFTSREYGTGAQFQQRAVGYATSRADCPPEALGASSMLPRKAEGLRFGVGNVEVSFAGGFFTFLPSVEYHTPMESVGRMVDSLRRTHEHMGFTTASLMRVHVVEELDLDAPRHQGSDAGDLRRIEVPLHFRPGEHVAYVARPALAEAESLAGPALEALVFIHGYNCDLATALGRMAQTFALGNMEPHIVPFVFSYSGGGPLSYFGSKAQMGLYRNDFAAFLAELGKRFQEVHVFTHSSGAHFFFTDWPAIRGCFTRSRKHAAGPPPRRPEERQPAPRWVPKQLRKADGSRMHLATLTMINPDVLVEDLLAVLPEIMDYAEHFTAYIDRNDQALFYSEWLQRLVPRWYQQRSPSSASTDVFGNTLKPVYFEYTADGRRELRGPLVESQPTRSEKWRSTLFSAGGMQEALSSPAEPNGSALVPGDGSVDIIDCSNIDQNVHKLRHNYYMLNTQMVEDLCELVGKRLTAPHRKRLTHVEANVFNFISPPRYLKEM